MSPDLALEIMGWDDANVKRVATGTLSAAFVASRTGESIFLKTHLLPEGGLTLEREATLFNHIYGNKLNVRCFAVRAHIASGVNKFNQAGSIWLAMAELEEAKRQITPCEVIYLIKGLNLSRLSQKLSYLIDPKDSMHELLELASQAFENLVKLKMLNGNSKKIVKNSLQLLSLELKNCKPILCHGDLSPANIMKWQTDFALVDWEDAFMGVEDYDYLYWLTFFENRKYYPNQPLQYVSIDIGLARALLVMVVVLKCQLAWRTKDFHKHSLSFDDRISEVSLLN